MTPQSIPRCETMYILKSPWKGGDWVILKKDPNAWQNLFSFFSQHPPKVSITIY